MQSGQGGAGWAGGCVAALVCVCLLGAPSASAQAVGTAPPSTTGPLQVNPQVALRDFEGSSTDEYTLGRGDAISIDFGGRPELNSKQVVGPDGMVTLPLVGQIKLADKTRKEAAGAVEAALSSYYSRLNVTVGVDRYTSNQVLLLGAVEHPGIQTFDRPPTLLEVVTRGGSTGSSRSNNFASGGSGSGGPYSLDAQLLPPKFGVPDRVAIYRGSDKVLWVDLKTLLDSGSPMADIRLRRDDIVYVPASSEKYVSVLGEVTHPGALQLDGAATIPKLLALAGGLTREAGRYPDIQVIQPSTGKTRVVSFKQVLQPGSLDLTLHSGDVIYVPESGFNRFAYVVEKISPVVTLFTASALIAQ